MFFNSIPMLEILNILYFEMGNPEFRQFRFDILKNLI